MPSFVDNVFEPTSDLDLDSGDMDDVDRDIEAFKRFCQKSVPLESKPKINFDVKDIVFKHKK